MRFREVLALTDTELTEASALSLGYYEPSEDEISHFDANNSRRPTITLRMLNRLKKIKRLRQRELEKKLELVPIIYGDRDYEEQQEKLDQQIYDAQANIEKDIEEAKMDQKQRDKIRKMAMRSISRIEN